MTIWLIIILGSAIVGAVCGYKIFTRWAIFAGGAIPWFVILAVLLYREYFVPSRGGGASMWPVAQLFAGSVAAGIGAAVAALVHSKVRSN